MKTTQSTQNIPTAAAPQNTRGAVPEPPSGDDVVVSLGRLVQTNAVHRWTSEHPQRTAQIATAVTRHQSGQWGNVDDEDRAANDEAVRDGDRVLSAWDVDHRRLWVITEADRSITTVLFPEDY